MNNLMTPADARKCKIGTFSTVARSLKAALPSDPVLVQYFAHQWNDVSKQREAVFACHANTLTKQFLGVFFVGAFQSLNE